MRKTLSTILATFFLNLGVYATNCDNVDIFQDGCNCVNFRDFSIFALDWQKDNNADNPFTLESEFETTTNYLQGIAYNDGYIYITYGGGRTDVANVIEKRNMDGGVVKYNDEAFDTTWELGGATIFEGKLYVAINGYLSGGNNSGYRYNKVGVYNKNTLELEELIEGNSDRFTRDYLEGITKKSGSFWLVYNDKLVNPVVEKYDYDWNYLTEYGLRTDLGISHKYQGISWYENSLGDRYAFFNLHKGTSPETLDKYYFDGKEFFLVDELNTSYGNQDIDIENNTFYWIKRDLVTPENSRTYITEYEDKDNLLGDFDYDYDVDFDDLKILTDCWLR